jgi:hypothetical protein
MYPRFTKKAGATEEDDVELSEYNSPVIKRKTK